MTATCNETSPSGLLPAAQDPNTMPQPDIAEAAQLRVNEGFVWIGFGTVAGLLAKAIMPGAIPGGPLLPWGSASAELS